MKFDIVVDNSALIEVVAGRPVDRGLMRRLSTSVAAAPELVDAEAMSVLRRMERSGHLTSEQASAALRKISEAPIERLPHRPLVSRAWLLRHSVHAFDSFYVALAEYLGVPLVTCDARLAGSNGHRVDIEVYPTS